MNFFEKIENFVFNTSDDYSQEEETYKILMEEINTIFCLVEIAMTSDVVLKFKAQVNGGIVTLTSLHDAIQIKKMQSVNASSQAERIKLQKEVEKLEGIYKRYQEDVRDLLLRYKKMEEIQDHLATINQTIYRRANLETLKEFLTEDLLTRKWTTAELIHLQKTIQERRKIIIPYLGESRK